ncbi:hypothetical protein ACFSCV_10145 [Methylopila henanensis]|uniref:Uncharacterized protein n=1 Tax=Methylopila henanensis TaxID=873516 RepID=A0ABW4KA05_9HYPH
MQTEIAWPARDVPETMDRESGITSVEVAERLSEGGTLDRDGLVARFRGFVRRNYITPAALYMGDRKGAYLYGAPEVFIGACLGRLCDHGFNDSDVLLAASNALTNWNVDDWPEGIPTLRADPSRKPLTPAEYLLDMHVTGVDGWALEIGSFRHPDDDRPRIKARVRNGFYRNPGGGSVGTNFHAGDGYELRTLTMIDLATVMAKLVGVVREPGAATH